jgi:hypothetical protein
MSELRMVERNSQKGWEDEDEKKDKWEERKRRDSIYA